MKVGSFDLPEELGKYEFKRFKQYYDQVLSGNITESAEEAFALLGGVLPEKKPKKAE